MGGKGWDRRKPFTLGSDGVRKLQAPLRQLTLPMEAVQYLPKDNSIEVVKDSKQSELTRNQFTYDLERFSLCQSCFQIWTLTTHKIDFTALFVRENSLTFKLRYELHS